MIKKIKSDFDLSSHRKLGQLGLKSLVHNL